VRRRAEESEGERRREAEAPHQSALSEDGKNRRRARVGRTQEVAREQARHAEAGREIQRRE
jgi:hypothetical protein